jgi:hypothetical protein
LQVAADVIAVDGHPSSILGGLQVAANGVIGRVHRVVVLVEV